MKHIVSYLNFVHEFLIVEKYDFAVVCSGAGTKTAHVGFCLLNLAKQIYK